MRSVREAVAGFGRAPLLGGLSIAAIGVSLLIVGLFAVAGYNVDRALSGVESRVEVVAYLRDDVDEELVGLATAEIEAYPEVGGVTYISKVEALYRASQEMTEFSDVFSDLEVNPLPASLVVRLAPGHRTPADAERVAERVEGYDFVEEVRYGREWVDRLYRLRRIVGGGALLLGASFAIGAVLLIGIAVRMAVLARRREISIMKTVGATESYIRRPFLVEGLLTGLLGGLVATALTYGAYRIVDRTLLPLEWVPGWWMAIGLAFAALLGMLAAARAVRRELRNIDVY
ncbi:MAG: permease-like cell division protein FtsX [Gemmatimonadales bacterium]|jgi:cell division transport system permease protein